MRSPFVVSIGAALFFVGCFGPQAPAMTPLEIQAMQSREFETSKEVLFASVMTVFQDLGYVIQSADKDTGFITANSPTKTSNSFWVDTKQQKQTKATAFVETLRQGVAKARLNFVTSTQTSTEQGQTTANDKPIMDGLLYQNAFDKIGEAVFVRMANQ